MFSTQYTYNGITAFLGDTMPRQNDSCTVYRKNDLYTESGLFISDRHGPNLMDVVDTDNWMEVYTHPYHPRNIRG